jgi:hypothetical protein
MMGLTVGMSFETNVTYRPTIATIAALSEKRAQTVPDAAGISDFFAIPSNNILSLLVRL